MFLCYLWVSKQLVMRKWQHHGTHLMKRMNISYLWVRKLLYTVYIYTGWWFLSCTLVSLILSRDVPPSCWAGAVCSSLAPGSLEIGSSHQTKIKTEYLIQLMRGYLIHLSWKNHCFLIKSVTFWLETQINLYFLYHWSNCRQIFCIWS